MFCITNTELTLLYIRRGKRMPRQSKLSKSTLQRAFVAGVGVLLLAQSAAGQSIGDDRAQAAAKAGRATAERVGVPVKAPAKKKVGVLVLYKSNETAYSMAEAVKEAVDVLGWEYTDCDGFGNPIRISSCADALLNQNVDILFATSIEPGIIRKQLDDARKRGVITVNYGSTVSDPSAYSGYF